MTATASCQRLSGPRSGEGLEVRWAGSDRVPSIPARMESVRHPGDMARSATDQLDLFAMDLVEAVDLEPVATASPRSTVDPAAPDPELAAHRVGARHEQHLELSGDRKRGGVFYTPPDVVDHLLDLALEPILDACGASVDRLSAVRVLDPSCGSGNFLAAVGGRLQRRLQHAGLSPSSAAARAYGECLVGIDIDPVAAALCVESLVHASGGGVDGEQMRQHIFCTDALELAAEGDGLLGTSAWQSLKDSVGARDGFDLVIGNPPFLSQLAAETVRDEQYTARIRQRFGDAVAGLTDTAVLFLMLAVESAQPDGGVACLIQPISVLSTRDAAGARAAALARSGMSAAWICEEKVFDASVRVCAPVFVRGTTPTNVMLLRGRAFEPAGSVPATTLAGNSWSPLLATAKGVPERNLRTRDSVREIAMATADFRDQYYGLRGCVVDDDAADDAAFPPLATSGLLDPAHILWGSRTTKFDKVTYEFPRVDMGRLAPRLQEWAQSRLRPKLMLATQTKVLEAVVDFTGRFIPSVPVVTVTTEDPADLWRLGALLSSPPITLVAARRHIGSALSSDALKLGASDVLGLPLPDDADAWLQAAQHFERASFATSADARWAELRRSAELMCAAFGLQDDRELLSWWSDRMPTPRPKR